MDHSFELLSCQIFLLYAVAGLALFRTVGCIVCAFASAPFVQRVADAKVDRYDDLAVHYLFFGTC